MKKMIFAMGLLACGIAQADCMIAVPTNLPEEVFTFLKTKAYDPVYEKEGPRKLKFGTYQNTDYKKRKGLVVESWAFFEFHEESQKKSRPHLYQGFDRSTLDLNNAASSRAESMDKAVQKAIRNLENTLPRCDR